MDVKQFRVFGTHLNSLASKCAFLIIIALILRAISLSSFSGIEQSNLFNRPTLSPKLDSQKTKFLEVPQIVWGLNNQKIAFARACLTAKMMNRTLLMPRLSASLFYKEVDLLKPISFDKVFQFEKFNSLCNGVVQLARYSEVSNITNVFELQKGSGRKWTVDKDLMQLRQKNLYDGYEIVRVVGKNPFLWHDHWPVKDYAKVFECLVLVDEISQEANKVVSKIKEMSSNIKVVSKIKEMSSNINSILKHVPYVAVHMRIEKDWMIHCKKLEQRLNVSEICSSKEQILERVGNIFGLKTPIVVYLAIADDLLEDDTIMAGWANGLVPFEKKKLGVLGIYEKHPYLIRSAIDYEVCLRSDVFVGNSFSTFSSLVVLDRTQKMVTMGDKERCGLRDVKWPSYAYNLEGKTKGSPRPWTTNMSDLSLRAISYGSNLISCQ